MLHLAANHNTCYNAFESLCEALSLQKRSRVAVLVAYLDESYNHRTEKNPNDPLIYTVAGCLSTVEKWSRFGKQWKSALKSRELDHFHMAKFESRIGVYETWGDTTRHAFFRRLKRIIKENTLYNVTLSVNCADYDELVIGDMRADWGKTYYGFDVRLLMKTFSEWADENDYQGKIHYVFAELKGQGGELDRIFTRCLKNPEVRDRFRLNGMWSKGLMREVVQLQAADVLAYELNKRAVNHFSAGKKRVRKTLDLFQYERNRLAPLYISRKEILELFKATGYKPSPT